MTSDFEKQVITHYHIKQQMEESNTGRNQPLTMKLRNRGRPAMFTVQRGVVKRRRLSLKTFQKAKIESGLSCKKSEKFISSLRKELGQKFVEPGLHDHLIEGNHIFDSNFKVELMEMEVKVESESEKKKRLWKLQQELKEIEAEKSKTTGDN
jgi:hypothetical protein